jgi:hypothetical protein
MRHVDVDMATFPIKEMRLRAARHVALVPEAGAADARSLWAETSSLVVAYSFSFKTQDLLLFDPPVLAACPPLGTELRPGPRKEPLLFRHVWMQVEVGMRALLSKSGSGISKMEGESMCKEVVFVGNISRLLDACRGVPPKDPIVYQLLRVNNIIYVASRQTLERQVNWTPGNALEEIWTTNCNKEKGSYVFFRGKVCENTVFYPSQVDAVRKKGSLELVELKLGRIRPSRLYQTFVQCQFKGIQSVDYVCQAFPCEFFEKGCCRKGKDCGFEHKFKKTSSDARRCNIPAPATFDKDMYTLDRLLSQLKDLVEIGKSSVLVVNGSMVLHSQIEMESPWLEVPSFFEEICFENSLVTQE